MIFNTDQQQAIDSRAHSIVSAGAGAGKTAVLVRRYTDLVREGVPVEGILCLTFTRKAAGEMYERLYRQFSVERDDPRISEEYDRFHMARITTIDAFCLTIVRNFAAEYGYPGGLSIADRSVSWEINQKVIAAVDTLGRRLPDFLAAHGLERIRDEFYPVIRNNLTSPLMAATSPSAAKLGSEDLARHFFDTMQADFQKNLAIFHGELDALRETAQSVRTSTSSKPAQNHCARIIELLDEYAGSEPLALWSADGAEKALEQFYGIYSALKATGRTGLKIFNDMRDTILAGRILPLLYMSLDRELYRDIAELAFSFQQEIIEFKRAASVLEYGDILPLAVDILRRHPEYADVLRREVKYIMVDEFQDNNAGQKELLFLLAAPVGYNLPETPDFSSLRPGVLFFVGDQKQSIYRFRGADVSVFRNLAGELPKGGQDISLKINYRSSPDLIAFFNGLFPMLMQGRTEYEAEYQEILPGASIPEPARIELLLQWDAQEDIGAEDEPAGHKEAEAYRIATEIRSMIDAKQQIYDKKRGQMRDMEYADVAILYGKSSIQFELEKSLRRMGIPYQADSTRSLFLDAPAYDTHAFFKLCLYPSDRMALASVLRSPLANIGDDSISEVLTHGGFAGDPAGLVDLMQTAQDRVHYQAFIDLYQQLTAAVDREPHIQLLANLWKDGGYERYMRADSRREKFLPHYDYLLEFFDLYSERPMTELIEDLGDLLGSPEREDELSIWNGNNSGVQLMTVHKSKGLEFPVVFVAYCDSGRRNSTDISAPAAVDKQGNLLLFAGVDEEQLRIRLPGVEKAEGWLRNPLIQAQKELEQQMEQAETVRLLYVAATRAEQHLFFTASGIRWSKSGAPEAGDGGNFFELLNGALQLPTHDVPEMSPEESLRLDCGAPLTIRRFRRITAAEIRRLRGTETPVPEFSGPVAELELPPQHGNTVAVTTLQAHESGWSPADADGHATAPALPGEPGEAAAFGTLVHYLLETGMSAAISGQGSAILARERVPDHLLVHQGVNLDYELAAEMAGGFFRNPLFEELKGAEAVYPEFPFTLYVKPFFINGQCDLLWIRDDVLHVMDFKTGLHVDPDHYRLQLSCYRLAAAKFRPDIATIRGFIADVRMKNIHEVDFTDEHQSYGEQDIVDVARAVLIEDN